MELNKVIPDSTSYAARPHLAVVATRIAQTQIVRKVGYDSLQLWDGGTTPNGLHFGKFTQKNSIQWCVLDGGGAGFGEVADRLGLFTSSVD